MNSPVSTALFGRDTAHADQSAFARRQGDLEMKIFAGRGPRHEIGAGTNLGHRGRFRFASLNAKEFWSWREIFDQYFSTIHLDFVQGRIYLPLPIAALYDFLQTAPDKLGLQSIQALDELHEMLTVFLTKVVVDNDETRFPQKNVEGEILSS